MLWQLDVTSQHRVLLHHAARLPLHRCRVNLVPIAHVRVLLAPLLERLGAAHDGAGEGLLTRMCPDMILEGAHRLTATTAIITLMLALT